MERITFIGIDTRNRAIFQSLDFKKNFFGCISKSFDYNATERTVLNKINESDLVYFGSKFNCEPMGTSADGVEIILNSKV